VKGLETSKSVARDASRSLFENKVNWFAAWQPRDKSRRAWL